MSQFDADKFMSEPCEDAFYDLKKDELISLAKYLKLEVKRAMRKHQNIIVQHLVNLKIFEQTVLETVEISHSELKKLQLQLEFKKLEMQAKLKNKKKTKDKKEWKKTKDKKDWKGKIEKDKKDWKEKKKKDKKEWKKRKDKKDWKGKIGNDKKG